MTKLRPYQEQAKAAVRTGYRDGLRRVLVVLPTGTGKTVIFADIAKDVYQAGKRVVVLVHLDTLVDQAYRKLCQVIPSSHVGIVKAAKNEVNAPVIVASIQTLARPNRLTQMIPPALTIVDEAHVSVSDSYLEYYRYMDATPGGLGYLCGFTATAFRADRRGLGDIWEKVVYRKSIKWAVNNGYLVRPEAVQYGEGVSTDGVRIDSKTDDFNDRDLQELVMVDDLRDTVVKGYKDLAEGQPAALFAPTQASVRYFLDAFNDAGIPAAEILASTTKATRIWNFAGFDAGTTSVLGSCTALAVGWDSPRCAVMLAVRPTRSQLMFIQQVGRILRPWPGKRRGLIIDYVGITDDASLASVVDLSRTPEHFESDGVCPECHSVPCVCDPDEVDDYERMPIPRTAKKITGITEVDLFAGTDARWLLTRRGVPFVQTSEHTFFVAPHEGEYAVGRCGAKTSHGGCWLKTGLTSEEALEQGSELALAEDPSLASKKSSWRQGRQEPSAQQKQLATNIGVNHEGLSKPELSDAIAIKLVSGLLAGIGA